MTSRCLKVRRLCSVAKCSTNYTHVTSNGDLRVGIRFRRVQLHVLAPGYCAAAAHIGIRRTAACAKYLGGDSAVSDQQLAIRSNWRSGKNGFALSSEATAGCRTCVLIGKPDVACGRRSSVMRSMSSCHSSVTGNWILC